MGKSKWPTILAYTIVAIWAIPLPGGVAAYDYFVVEPEYNKAVRGHIISAYWADTPELMIEELKAARQGMEDLGLTPDMYSDPRPWKQTPDRSMRYQYAHIDAIIERAYDVIEWREGHRQGHGGEINDVYGSKMRDLRDFIREDTWSDWIAKDTFYLHNYTWLSIWHKFAGWFVFAWLLTAGAVTTWAGFRHGLWKAIKEAS
jgi:hypothetical protein